MYPCLPGIEMAVCQKRIRCAATSPANGASTKVAHPGGHVARNGGVSGLSSRIDDEIHFAGARQNMLRNRDYWPRSPY